MQITRLRCEYLENPLGLEVARPRLFWQMQSPRAGARQIAYRITTDNGWDSGRVASAQSAQIVYDGPILSSRQRVGWSVEVEDETGATTRSETAFWEMGLLDSNDWRADFIAGDLAGGPHNPMPAPFFRRAFEVAQPIKRARLYASALGVYECEINGHKVGADVLAPGWTDYNKRLAYQTYDVTEMIERGENVLGAVVGDGWYCGHIGWRERQNYGQKPQFCGQLEIEFEGGSRQTIASGADWQFAYGPILSADLLIGEDYDARLKMDGWSAPGFDVGASWRGALVGPKPALEWSASSAPPIVKTQEIQPVGMHRHGGAVIFDMGQNMVGRIRIKIAGERGQTLKFRFAEILQDGPLAVSGPIYNDNLRGGAAQQTDHYTLRGDGEESWEPRFTFHGFRYVEVSGLTGEPTLDFLTGVVLHTRAEQTGDFECSDPLVNQLWRNIDWGWRGNSLDVPTDCPQRDERLGWTGDAQVFVPTSCFLRDVPAFWTKWARDVADAQHSDGSVPCVIPLPGTRESLAPLMGEFNAWHDGGPAWADATLICPWTLYRRYGDVRILEENYGVFKNYLNYLESTSRDNMRCDEHAQYWRGFGDWLALDGSGDTEGGTPKELIGTAFYAHCADLMSRIARATSHAADEQHYRELFERVAQTFCERFVTPAGRLSPPYQTPYVLALHFNLLPENLRAQAVKELVGEIKHRGEKLSTGFVGTSYLPFVLSENGANQTAYELLLQHDWPSYLYAVTQGATTIWERWDGWTQKNGFQDAGMNSFNHYAYGAIGDWMAQVVAGIRAGDSGYQNFKLQPRPGADLTSATAHYDSLYGRIESAWKIEDGEMMWDFVVPANTAASVVLPNGESFEASAGKYSRRVKL